MRCFQTFGLMLAIAGCTPDAIQGGDTGGDGSPGVHDGPGETIAEISQDYLPAALEIIGEAQQRVHLIEFVIYEGTGVDDIIDALIDAEARGVEVKLLADETGSGTQSALDWLSQAGVDTRLDSPNTTTHNKLIIADNQTLVGSHNFTTSAMLYNNEASVLVRDVEVSTWYESYFQALWADSDHDPVLQPPPDPRIVPISNRDAPEHLLSCLAGAQERVRVVLYAFSYSAAYPTGDLADLAAAVEDANARGVDVQVVLDGSDWMVENDINTEIIERFQASGVPLRTTASDVVTHAKVLVCDDTAIVGDANWSYSSFEYYNGTSVQVDDPVMAQDFVDWADELWASATAPAG